MRRVYYPEVERAMLERTGAAEVVVFDHNWRRAAGAVPAEGGRVVIKEPVSRVHNDFTLRSGPERAAAELSARGRDAAAVLKSRFALINLWRPIREPVEDFPLAVCDAQTIAARDLVPSDLVYRDRVGETYSVTFNPAHRWFYFPHMRLEEALFIKCFDSAADGRARFTAHSAFANPAAEKAPPRESIEARALVLF